MASVGILGAGLSGLVMGIQLKRLGIDEGSGDDGAACPQVP